jgi:hypothetical protein
VARGTASRSTRAAQPIERTNSRMRALGAIGVPVGTGRQHAVPRNDSRLAADYSAAVGKITQTTPCFKPHRDPTAPVILLFTVMVRSVHLRMQGHEARSHADVTDRDRDESSRRVIIAWVRTNPQTHAR